MKKTLLQEIKRIQEITYKDIIVNEQLNSIFDNTKKKIDISSKADFINPNVKDFYDTLQRSIDRGGLNQQQRGSMSYQKEVEALQIALTLLGYNLPKYGIDGLFGPETAAAVGIFKKDNNILNEETIQIKGQKNPNYGPITATPETINLIVSQLKSKNITPEKIDPYIDPVENTTGSKGFTELDLTTNEGISKYAEICDEFISGYKNPLEITGNMLASGAVKAYKIFGRYVPPELALSQLLLEGGINSDPTSRPVRTRNPFNVGNVDSGANVNYDSVQVSIDVYYKLIASKYIGKGKTVQSLLTNFVNKSGNRYASSANYETHLASIIPKINKIAQRVMA
jgi:hypothetical protein